MQDPTGRCRSGVNGLVAVLVLALRFGELQSAPLNSVSEATVQAVESVAVTVSDMDRSLAFYEEVLGFVPESDVEVAGEAYEHLYGVFGLRLRTVRLRLGEEHLELMQFLAPGGRPMPVDSRGNDGWFQHVALIVSDIDRAYARLRQFKVPQASSGPQRLPDWNPDAAGISAYYFRDPDGHFLEILQFPPGKGAAKWHVRSGELFLGIDHTAIVVADTDASLKFYRDTLGLKVAGASENYGTEQEHLNNVFGARLRITALRAPEGPGVELLEYLAPRSGRAMPADSQASDLWHWLINMRAGIQVADRALRAGHYRYVSPGPVTLRGGATASGLLVRDADGHAVMLRESRQ
jgi:catechol 2,3-dioxygenase-like lactoylglutathione lyase family enzyme